MTPALAALFKSGTFMSPSDAQMTMPTRSYAAGGTVSGDGGTPIRPNIPGITPQGQGRQGLGPQQMEMEAQRFIQQHPDQVAEIQQSIQEALSEGAITMDQVTVLGQMAKVALQNPDMYPQLRQMVIQKGIVEEDEISPEFDQGMLFVFLLIGQIMQNGAGAGTPPPTAAQPAGGEQIPATAPPSGLTPPSSPPMQNGLPSMAKGGTVPGGGKYGTPTPIVAHHGEYVVPLDTVMFHGTDKLDKLVQKAREAKLGLNTKSSGKSGGR